MKDMFKKYGCLTKHHGGVTSLMFSPVDHRLLASSGNDGKIKITDIEAGTVKKAWHHPGSEVISVAFSPSGTSIAGGLSDGTVIVFDVASGNVCCTLRGHTCAARSVSWSPCSKYLASGSDDQTIRIWDVKRGSEEADPLTGHTFWVTSLSWSPQGTLLASGSADRTVRVWHTATWKLAYGPLMEHIAPVVSVTWCPDGQQVASGCTDGKICVWNVALGAKRILLPHKNKVWIYEICDMCRKHIPDKSTVNRFHGHSICCECWQPYQESFFHLVHTISATSDLCCLSWSPVSQYIASGGRGLEIWHASRGEMVQGIGTSGVECVVWSADGLYLAAGCASSSVHLWNVKKSEELGEIYLHNNIVGRHQNVVLSVAFSPNGEYVATGSADCAVTVWKASSWKETIAVLMHKKLVRDVVWSPDSKALATGSEPFCVQIWDMSPELSVRKECLLGHNLRKYEDNKKTSCSVCNKERKARDFLQCRLCAFKVCGQECLEITWRLKQTLERKGGNGVLQSVRWSPNGKYVVSWHENGIVYIWKQAKEEEAVVKLAGYIGANVSSVEWSPDCQYITTVGASKSVCVWGVANGQKITHPLNLRLIPPQVSRSLEGVKVRSCSDPFIVGPFVVTASKDKVSICLKDRPGQRGPIAEYRAPSHICSMAQEGAHICIGCTEGQVNISPSECTYMGFFQCT
jgi:WD40 repeat protein